MCCVGVIACACLWHRRQCFAGTQGAFMCGISAICHDRSQACLREKRREAAPVRRGLAHASEPPQGGGRLPQATQKGGFAAGNAARTCKKLPVASFCASETAETGRIANGREQGDHVSRRSRFANLWTPETIQSSVKEDFSKVFRRHEPKPAFRTRRRRKGFESVRRSGVTA